MAKPANRKELAKLRGQVQQLTKALAEQQERRSRGWPAGLPEFRELGRLSAKADSPGTAVRPGVVPDDDQFYQFYSQYTALVEPLVPFEWLWRIYQQCDTLNICVHSYVDNICNPADLTFHGTQQEKLAPVERAKEIELRDFFSRINERYPFVRLRRKMERSMQVCNVWFVQVIRDENRLQPSPNGGYRDMPVPNRMYYIPAYQMRATTLGEELVPVKILLPRRGKLEELETQRQFRRFARIQASGRSLMWFKELGDPRILSSRTGEFYRKSDGTFYTVSDRISVDDEATEIWWHRDNYEGSIYGLPRWFSVFWDVKGRQEAKWVNFDHLDRGAIPPGMLAVSGGKLQEGSKQQLDRFLMDWRTPSAYGIIPYLEVTPEINMDINSDGSSSKTIKIEWIKLRDPQHEDYMFGQYLEKTEEAIGSVFRLPPVLRGKTNTETYASAATAIEITESQVFQPLRSEFDAKVTVELIQNEFGFYGWQFKTQQSKIGDKETFYRAITALSRASGLSINELRELANQLLGTTLRPFKGAIYDEPITVVMSLANQGMLTFESQDDGEHGALVFMGKVQDAASTIAEAVQNPPENATKADIEKTKEEALTQLVGGLTSLAALKYEAPDEEKRSFELMPGNAA